MHRLSTCTLYALNGVSEAKCLPKEEEILMSMNNGRNKQDNLSYSEFSRLIPQGNPDPSRDSPGDSGEDRLAEVLVGMDYDEESEQDLRDPLDDSIDEGDPTNFEKVGESVVDLDDETRVVASQLPGDEQSS